MRQAGILAAAGIVALEKMVIRLDEDHQRARKLAQGLRELDEVSVEKDPPPSNMVYLSLEPGVTFTAIELAEQLRKMSVLVSAVSETRIRLVLHYWIHDEHIEETITRFKKVLNSY